MGNPFCFKTEMLKVKKMGNLKCLSCTDVHVSNGLSLDCIKCKHIIVLCSYFKNGPEWKGRT